MGRNSRPAHQTRVRSSLLLTATRTTDVSVTKMTFIVGLVFFLHLMAVPRVRSSDETGTIIRYSVFEELPANTFIGNIKTNSNLLEQYGRTVVNQLELDFHQTSRIYSSYFRLDSRQGLLWTAKVLDREKMLPITDIELSIRVTPFQYFQILKVIVTIIDKNDNIPTFPDTSINLVLSENTKIGSLFALPSAEDADGGTYGIQNYDLIANTNHFNLQLSNNSDGSIDVRLVLLKELDREAAERFDLVLDAWDGGHPPQSGQLYISVTVTDANDNSPKFQQSEYQASVVEGTHYSLALLRLVATDADDGPNGHVVYELASHTDDSLRRMFHVNNVTGDVTLRGRLDYEMARMYSFTVAAKDLGHNSMTSFAKVTVRVLDLNDNGPHITLHTMTGHGDAAVTENCPPGTFVTHLAVSDLDDGENGRVNCTLESRMFELIRVSHNEYKVITKGNFDREEREMHQVRITCADNGLPSLSAMRMLSVHVIDENDNAPEFARNVYSVNFKENNTVGAEVIKMNATDKDIGKNAQLMYSMKEALGTPRRMMSIDSFSGIVYALVPLDYEKRMLQLSYVVTATDGGDVSKTTSTLLNVTVLDVNDEAPKFLNKSYTFYVRENTSPPVDVGLVTAVDLDSNLFNHVVYALTPRHPLSTGCFAIDRHSGLIITLKSLDRELLAHHELIVTASNDVIIDEDRIVENVMSNVNITIVLADENDNRPVFVFPSKSNRSVQVAENAVLDSFVATLVANDPDLNNKVSFELISGDRDGLFYLNANSGVLTVAKSLKAYVDAEFEFLVGASDNSLPPMRSSETLYVKIVKAPALSAIFSSTTLSLFEGDNFIIVGGVIGGVLLIVTCIVLVSVTHRCRVASRKKRFDRYIGAYVSDDNRQVADTRNGESEQAGENTCMLRHNYEQMQQINCKQCNICYSDTACVHVTNNDAIPDVDIQAYALSGSMHRGLTVRWKDATANDNHDTIMPYDSSLHNSLSSPRPVKQLSSVDNTAQIVSLPSSVRSSSLVRNVRAEDKTLMHGISDKSCLCMPHSTDFRQSSPRTLGDNEARFARSMSPSSSYQQSDQSFILSNDRFKGPYRLSPIGLTDRSFDTVSITDSGQGGSEEGEHVTSNRTGTTSSSHAFDLPIVESIDKLSKKSKNSANSKETLKCEPDIHQQLTTSPSTNYSNISLPRCNLELSQSCNVCRLCDCQNVYVNRTVTCADQSCTLCLTARKIQGSN